MKSLPKEKKRLFVSYVSFILAVTFYLSCDIKMYLLIIPLDSVDIDTVSVDDEGGIWFSKPALTTACCAMDFKDDMDSELDSEKLWKTKHLHEYSLSSNKYLIMIINNLNWTLSSEKERIDTILVLVSIRTVMTVNSEEEMIYTNKSYMLKHNTSQCCVDENCV